MSSTQETIDMTLQIGVGEDLDTDDLNLLTRALISELEDLPLEAISTPSGSVSQSGGKGLDPVTWGALAGSHGIWPLSAQ